MFYNQYPYNIFNNSSLEEFIKQQQQLNENRQHHLEQQNNIIEMRKAIADYCKAARKVSQDYKDMATNQCLQEIIIQAGIDGYRF